MLPSVFGSRTRSRTLAALQVLNASYARELARLLGAPLNGVQAALQSLERDGLVVARSVGRTRLFQLNPRFFALEPLKALLARLAAADPELMAAVTALRRRPRRTGKPA
jgi:DNA-binding IclR family transcriptional regulator